jgi:HPt (histidine-containing phosphotransfer) domain-containing protein
LLEEFNGFGDLIDEVIDALKTAHPPLIAKLADALARGDGSEAAKCCHSLRGASATITADQLAQSCRELENLALAGDFEQAHSKYEQLLDDWSRLQHELDAFQHAHTANSATRATL